MVRRFYVKTALFLLIAPRSWIDVTEAFMPEISRFLGITMLHVLEVNTIRLIFMQSMVIMKLL